MIFNVKNYDGKINELSKEVEKFNNYIQSGSVSIIHVAPNSYTDVEVYFPTTFYSAPNVVACFESASTSVEYSNLALAVRGITSRGFIIRVFAGDTSVNLSPSARWIAVKLD